MYNYVNEKSSVSWSNPHDAIELNLFRFYKLSLLLELIYSTVSKIISIIKRLQI